MQLDVLSPPGRAIVVGERWLGSNANAVMNALRRKGWNVTDFAQREYIPLKWKSRLMKIGGKLLRSGATRELNNAIIKTANEHQPDLFLAFKGTYVMPSTLDYLKNMGVKTYCIYPDVSFHVHGPYIPKALPRYDWVFTTKTFGMDDMRNQLGVTQASCIQHAADPDLHHPIDLTERDLADFGCDASFIGTWSPKKERILTELIEKLPELTLKVFGSQWDRVPASSLLQKHIIGYPVYTLDYVKAIQASKINIAILSEARSGASSGDLITSRTFHIPASGGFMLHERTDEVCKIFEEDNHIACFADVEELGEKIMYYLSKEKERIQVAQRGCERVTASHTWNQRIEIILSKHVELTNVTEYSTNISSTVDPLI